MLLFCFGLGHTTETNNSTRKRLEKTPRRRRGALDIFVRKKNQIHTFTHSLTHSLTDTHSDSLTHSFTHQLQPVKQLFLLQAKVTICYPHMRIALHALNNFDQQSSHA